MLATRLMGRVVTLPFRATTGWLMQYDSVGPSILYAYPAQSPNCPGELIALWPGDKAGRCSILLGDFTQECSQVPGLPRVVTMWSPTQLIEVQLMVPPSPAERNWPPRGYVLTRLFPHPWKPEAREMCERWVKAAYSRRWFARLPSWSEEAGAVVGKDAPRLLQAVC